MRWSFKIARVAGIDVRIHLTFLLLPLWFAFNGYQHGGAPAAIGAAVFSLLVFLCVLLHEFGHALTAQRYGIRTADITLWPIGGVARLERLPDQPMQELVVALAGPAVNVVIAAVLALALGLGGAFHDPGADANVLQLNNLPLELLIANVWLVIFNLIPAFPMDGGRVLRALLATRLPYPRATQIAANVGQGCAILFGFWAFFGGGGPTLVLIAFFIFFAAGQEATAAQMRDLTRNVRLDEALITDFKTLALDATLADAVALLLRGSQHDFPVVNSAGQVAGVLTRQDLIAALGSENGGPRLRVAEVMRTDIPSVPAGASFETAFRAMQECACPAVPVVDRAGRLVGLITPENVGEMMMIHSVLAHGGQPAWRTAAASGDASPAELAARATRG
ncbi:MAG: site-2 protease family protein [Verrucomicrobia bacterium]|nr:site-2 protease family protein [Verrucomicrobiota bacterium]MBV9659500.1 site-2 protease family protein [Verrucomicrobiota bacterium]